MHSRQFRRILLLSAIVLAGCNKPQEPPAPKFDIPSLAGKNIVIIVLDSVRADHLGAYGYDRDTTPFIDSLADAGLVFEDASANSSYISQSMSALLSGRLPTSSGAIGMSEAHPLDETPTMPEFFSRAGYYTGLLSNQPLIRGRGFTKGFEELQIGELGKPWPAEALSARALEFVEDAGDDPFFLYLHFNDPHQPYEAPGFHRDRFVRDAGTDPLDAAWFRREYENAAQQVKSGDDPRVHALVDRYDGEIAYTDEAIRDFVEGLAERGVGENTVLIITSTHGEEFMEHGYLGHAWTLNEEVLRVPLILSAANALPAQRIPTPVSHVDLLPTLLALIGTDSQGATFDGEALFVSEGDTFAFAPPAKPQIAELIVRERCIVRSLRDRGYKYIAAQKWAEPAERYAVAASHNEIANQISEGAIEAPALWSSPAHEEFYDLRKDPLETKNLSAKGGKQLTRLRALLKDYESFCRVSALAPRELTGRLEVLDASEIEDLESLGYL